MALPDALFDIVRQAARQRDFLGADFRVRGGGADPRSVHQSPQDVDLHLSGLCMECSAQAAVNIVIPCAVVVPDMKPSASLAAHRGESRQLVSRYGLARARIFGSVLAGSDDEESDLDLPVDPTQTTSLFTLAGFKANAEELLGVPLRPHPRCITAEISQRGLATGAAAMKHPERVEDYLEHITKAIERATRYVQPLPDIDAFRQNPMVQDAVVRNIEIIGEAAIQINRMAPDFIARQGSRPGAPVWPAAIYYRGRCCLCASM
jgi:predicted nucleotidyltransferase